MPDRDLGPVQTIGVDFDGVLHAYSRGWQDGTIYDPPVDGAIDGLRALMGRYAVFVFTSRPAAQVAAWLHGQGVAAVTGGTNVTFWVTRDIVYVTNRKLPALAYLDDRAVRFTSWPQALGDLL